MPTYSYKCTECGTAFDIQQAFTDDSLTECPNCGGKLRKVFSAIGVTFNGSGFYRNDSRATGKSSESAGSAKSEGSKSDAKSSDSKSSESKSSESKTSSSQSEGSKSSSSSPSSPASSPSKAAG